MTTLLATALPVKAAEIAWDAGTWRAQAQRVLDVPLAAADLAMVDGQLWVGSRGLGLIAFNRGQRAKRFDVGHGLPSAVVHHLGALRDGRILVGTDRGLVLIDLQSGESRSITPPSDARVAAVDLLVSSERGSTAIFQLAPVEHSIGGAAAASLWRWNGQRVQPWDPKLGPGLLATAGYYDHLDGCIHIAGIQSGRSATTPWYARDCAGKLRGWRLEEGAPRGTIGVAGLARASEGEGKVLIVVTQPTSNPASRRYVAMELNGEGRLTAHCSNATYREPVTGFVRHGSELIVARRGVGVEALTCDKARALSDDPRLRETTVLVSDPQAGLLAATDMGVFQVKDDRSILAMADWSHSIIPADALPMQTNAAGSRVLLSSPTVGPLEVERVQNAWQLARRWRTGIELPRAIFGPSVYADNGDVLTIARSQAVLRLQNERVVPIEFKGSAAPWTPLDIASTSQGLWIATGATPFDSTGAGLHFISTNGTARFVALPDRQAQPSGRMLAWPDGRVWVGTRIGVIEADPNGASRRLSAERVDALYRNDALNIVGAVGASVQYWNGDRLSPVIFAIKEADSPVLGHPVDLIIDDKGRWVILYSDGHLVLLDEQRRFVATLGARSGIPPSSRRLLYLPKSDEVLIGSAREGLFSLRWPRS